MERSRRDLRDERTRRLSAFARWKDVAAEAPPAIRTRAAIGGPPPALPAETETPEQRAQFERRQQLRLRYNSPAYRAQRLALERKIGATLDFADLPPDEQALKAGRPVARIVTLGGPDLQPEGFATGFLVASDLLMTNYHVFRTAAEADNIGAQFLYERTRQGLRTGIIFRLDPGRFFINDKDLDYAIVAVSIEGTKGELLNQFQFLPLISAKGKIKPNQPVNIIQHPEGDPKQYATTNNRLIALRDDGFLLYETDTLEGSSGSPLFNTYWEAIGLHHCGVPQIENDMLVTRDGRHIPLEAEVADSDLVWIANEGIRVSALVDSLAKQRVAGAEQQDILKRLIAGTADPLQAVADPTGPSPSPSPISVESLHPMTMTGTDTSSAPVTLQFTGPVTIHIGTSAAVHNGEVSAVLSAPVATAAVAPQDELPFRERALRFDEGYASRDTHGYRDDFLTGWRVPAPTINADHKGAILQRNGQVWVIPYYHYSVVMNKDRRLVAWTASNVDYSAGGRKFTRSRSAYGGESWRLDPRVAMEAPGVQLQDREFYAPATKIDRGHIVRREDACWGATADEAEFGNSDTYHWTNCTPQSEAFNKSSEHGIWGQFEEYIEDQIKAESGRMCVFAGPVLNPEDPEHAPPRGAKIRVPMQFWKVIAAVSKENGHAVKRAYGFLFDQTEPIKRLGFERLTFTDYKVNQCRLADITQKTGVAFDASLLTADVLGGGRSDEAVRGVQDTHIAELEQVILR